MKSTLFSENLPNRVVRCQTCSHFCVLQPDDIGFCGVRKNIKGQIKVLNYGQLIARALDPIEKKPFFNFLPGAQVFSIAAAGCNFTCQHCQNWQISQVPKNQSIKMLGAKVEPSEIIDQARKTNCAGLAYTYTEPTVFAEYALAIMKLAKAAGLKNCWVSNGYMSDLTRNAIIPYLDAINIDLKAFSENFYTQICQARLAPVRANLIAFKKAGVWLEVTTLLIPGLNDSVAELTRLANFIKKNLGATTPWHISRFNPEISHHLKHLNATSVKNISQAVQIGKVVGLKYVYSGNIVDTEEENTYCPNCHELIIDRQSGDITLPHGQVSICPSCQKPLRIIWE
jgi:pyruvate formate lyase activating enzyme